jgi:hypothetical protein
MKPMPVKQFKGILDRTNDTGVRNQVIQELIDQATPKLNHRLLDIRNRQQIQWAISEFKKKQRLGSRYAYRIYLLAEFSVELVNQYHIEGTKIYRKSTKRRNEPPRKKQYTPRRPSIYGWDGSLVPRSYLDKLSVKIYSQADYDRMREKEMGFDKSHFQKVNGIHYANGERVIHWEKT